MEQKTPLYDCHVRCGGKIVPFAGYLLPVQYQTGVIAEHMAVRTACGLFDVSHMGEVLLKGPDALKNLQHLFTNDYASMRDGKVRYGIMLTPGGGVVDDLIVYRLSENAYWVVVNAANRHKDVAWMRENLLGGCTLTDMSDEVSQLALQGPMAEAILSRLTADALPAGYYSFVPHVCVAGVDCLVSRTGYTGEDGFELYCANAAAPRLWDALLTEGAPDGLIPCGLGARDTLRLEAGMPLYGHEMDDTVTPLEAGLGWAVKLGKEEFIGKAALLAQKPARRRVGLDITGRGIAREHCDVWRGGERVGATTSGTHCPYLKRAVAMALVNADVADGEALEVDVRGRRVEARVIPLPFYQRKRETI